VHVKQRHKKTAAAVIEQTIRHQTTTMVKLLLVRTGENGYNLE